MVAAGSTELVVVRHGETVWNLDGRQQGHLDSPLTELGVRQAEALASALRSAHCRALYSSDLGRAAQTAAIVGRALGLQVVTDERLRERHLGILQGRTMADFEREHPDHYALLRGSDPDYAIPGGESARQRHERCVACAEEVARRHTGQSIVLVTHGGPLGSLMRHALGLPLAGPRRFSLLNASINTFAFKGGEWRLVNWGDTHHLRGLGTMDDW
jgi:probable phosphoglycerate mutase